MDRTGIGYTNPLFVMPFDHRGSFQAQMFGIRDREPTEAEIRTIAAYKRIVYDGLIEALACGVPRDKAAILVDEQFGAECAIDAARQGIKVAMSAEKSGQAEFEFEYGDRFGDHIARFNPAFVKVLVRYNVESDPAMNRRQAERLARLGDYCHAHGHKFMFELLVPPTEAQLARMGGDRQAYDLERRSGLMARAIGELQDRGVEADIWKLEGLESAGDYRAIVAQARQDGRDRVGIIVLGRGENAEKVNHWLRVGAQVEGVIGFAVGRTVFWEALTGYRDKQHDRSAAVAMIARIYTGFVHLFIGAQGKER
jgi:5-dehydro-2-deoxygluconokinase